MIRNKKLFYIAIGLLLFILFMNLPFPHHYSLGELIGTFFGIPVRSVTGIHYGNIFLLFLIIGGLFALSRSLEKYRGRFVLLALFILIVGPSYIVDVIQNTFASDIYAVSYERHASHCIYEMINDDTLRGECGCL
ncbi:hypothetical protein [Alkalihalobacterium sp. APHAB7]|uniref:hypothetical protein n=1 Tax=Alkalihalobacterium sp. APHAB7 TaxID=3402081 RepID=UPI003AAA9053